MIYNKTIKELRDHPKSYSDISNNIENILVDIVETYDPEKVYNYKRDNWFTKSNEIFTKEDSGLNWQILYIELSKRERIYKTLLDGIVVWYYKDTLE